MRRNIIETIIAGLVLIVGLGFLVYVVDSTEQEHFAGYALQARFEDAPSLKAGAEVRIAGVLVGRVTGVALDRKRFDVLVDFEVAEQVKLPTDSQVVIGFDGVIGDAILILKPGQESAVLQAGDRVRRTVSPVNIVDQLGRFIFTGAAADDF
jgi:phospholipid/cholesterol/gamma-HCH transport system substrate-binding protein